MTANTTFVSGAVLTAAQMNALPWGVVDATAGGTSSRGWASSTTNFTMTTTMTDVTSMTVTFTPVTGRLYRASFDCMGDNVATAQYLTVVITNSANTVQAQRDQYMLSAGQNALAISRTFTGLSGSTTLKIRAKTSAANSAILNGASSFTFVVEDIGPST